MVLLARRMVKLLAKIPLGFVGKMARVVQCWASLKALEMVLRWLVDIELILSCIGA